VHYVERHWIVLPNEFVAIAIASRGMVPALNTSLEGFLSGGELPAVDPTFWNDWFDVLCAGAG
jgi:hypothetical protein